MTTAEVAGVAGEGSHAFPRAAAFVLNRIAHIEFSDEGGDLSKRVINGVKRHPFGAVVAGLAFGLAALAVTDRLTRKW